MAIYPLPFADIDEPELMVRLIALIFTPLKEFKEVESPSSVNTALLVIIKLLKRYSPANKDMSLLIITSISSLSATPFSFKSDDNISSLSSITFMVRILVEILSEKSLAV